MSVLTTANGLRQFACFPVALQAIIVNPEEKILLLSNPRRREGAWQVVSGAMEAGESVLEGVLREVREEAGAEVRVRPLGAVHIDTFRYDENVHMIGIDYLLAYEGGEVRPGDDMVGSAVRWWSLEELADESVNLFVPTRGVLRQAVELYRLLK